MGGTGGSALENGFDPRRQLARAEGFGYVIVRTQFQAKHPIQLGITCRQNQYWKVGIAPQAFEQLQPRSIGQADIENRQIGSVAT